MNYWRKKYSLALLFGDSGVNKLAITRARALASKLVANSGLG